MSRVSFYIRFACTKGADIIKVWSISAPRAE